MLLLLLSLELRAAAVALDVVREEEGSRWLGAETQRVRVLSIIGDYYLIERGPELAVITFHAAAGTRRALGLRILSAIHWGISHDPTRIQGHHLNVTGSEIILQALGNIEGVWSATTTPMTLMQSILLLYG